MAAYTSQLDERRNLGKNPAAAAKRFMQYFSQLPITAEDRNIPLLARAGVAQQKWGKRVQFNAGYISGEPYEASSLKRSGSISEQGATTSAPARTTAAEATQPTEIRTIDGQAAIASDPEITAKLASST